MPVPGAMEGIAPIGRFLGEAGQEFGRTVKGVLGGVRAGQPYQAPEAASWAQMVGRAAAMYMPPDEWDSWISAVAFAVPPAGMATGGLPAAIREAKAIARAIRASPETARKVGEAVKPILAGERGGLGKKPIKPPVPEATISKKEALKFANPEKTYIVDEIYDKGLTVNSDGTVTLYHATTKGRAPEIIKSGTFKTAEGAPDAYGVYFSTSKEVAGSYGDGTLVKVRVKLNDLNPDDAFPGRPRLDFQVKTRQGIYKPVSIEAIPPEVVPRPPVPEAARARALTGAKPPVPEAVAPSILPTAEKGPYLYHGTPMRNIESIRREGLKSNLRQRNDFGNLRGENPDFPREEELLYFTKTPADWGGKEAVALRINEDFLPRGVKVGEDMLRPGEFYTTGKEAYEIPVEAIEFFHPVNGHWQPLKTWKGEMGRKPIQPPVPGVEIGDIITTNIQPRGAPPVIGQVVGEGILGRGAAESPAWTVRTGPGPEGITAIPKDFAKVLVKGPKAAAKPPRVKPAVPPAAPEAVIPKAGAELTVGTRLNLGRTQGNRLILEEAGILDPSSSQLTISKIITKLDEIRARLDKIPTSRQKGPQFRKIDNARITLLKLAEQESGLTETGLRNIAEGLPPPRVPTPVPPEAVASGVAKEPWQMTREEFIGRRIRPARGFPEPTVENLGNFLREKAGKPGITQEPEFIPRFQMELPSIQNFVYRNAKGEPIGILKVNLTSEGKVEFSNLAVLPGEQRKGIATKLIKAAKEAGLDIEPVRGLEGQTEAGAALQHGQSVKRALSEGKPVPPEVLADYPELVAKAVPKPSLPEAAVAAAKPPEVVPPVGPKVAPEALEAQQVAYEAANREEYAQFLARAVKGMRPDQRAAYTKWFMKGRPEAEAATIETRVGELLGEVPKAPEVPPVKPPVPEAAKPLTPEQEAIATQVEKEWDAIWDSLSQPQRAEVLKRAGMVDFLFIDKSGEALSRGDKSQILGRNPAVFPGLLKRLTIAPEAGKPPILEAPSVKPPPVAPVAAEAQAVVEKPPPVKPPTPPGQPPVKPPRGKGPGNPGDSFRELVDNPVPGQRPGEPTSQVLVRQHEGVLNRYGAEVRVWAEDTRKALKTKAPKAMRQFRPVRTSEAEEFIVDLAERASGGRERVAARSPGLLPYFDELAEKLAAIETRDTAHSAEMGRELTLIPDYFPDLWADTSAMKRVVGRLIGKGRPGVREFFEKQRSFRTTREAVEAGKQFITYDPIDLIALRDIAGQRRIQGDILFQKAQAAGLIVRDVKGKVPQGWRQPQGIPAFNPKHIPHKAGARAPLMTPGYAVPEEFAKRLEDYFGTVGRSTNPAINALAWTAGQTKKLKVFASFFQHMDFLRRGTASKLFVAGKPAQVPEMVIETLEAMFSRGKRTSLLREWTTDPFLRSVADEGAGIIGGQSIARRALSNLVEDIKRFPILGNIPETTPVIGKLAKTLNQITDFVNSGLFDGVYLAQAKHLAKDWGELIRKAHPKWTEQQVAASVADQMSLTLSSQGAWQSVFRNQGTRQLTRGFVFSSNESEALLRGFMRILPGVGSGEARALWQRYWVGYFLTAFLTAEVVNKGITGDFLGPEQLSPIRFDETGRPKYNWKFLRPIMGFLEDKTPIYVDLLGQLDTPLRWGIDPPQALLNRLSVPVRQVLDQVRNAQYTGRPIATGETFPERIGERALYTLKEVGTPITPGQVLGEKGLPLSAQALQVAGLGVVAPVPNTLWEKAKNKKQEGLATELQRLEISSGRVTGKIAGKKLSPEERDRYQETTDTLLLTILPRMLSTRTYQKLSDDNKKWTIEMLMSASREEARAIVIGKATLKGSQRRLKTELNDTLLRAYKRRP